VIEAAFTGALAHNDMTISMDGELGATTSLSSGCGAA
jgi:hypothetical protein